ncbi:hypothetical protein Hanom_Chr01g00006171 [Helianthus anomalus]
MARSTGIHVYNVVLFTLLIITVQMLASANAECTTLLAFSPKFCDGDTYVSDDCWGACRDRFTVDLVKANCDYMSTFPGQNKSVCKCWYLC